SETSNSLATNYFLFKNIWGGEALKLAFNPETMQIQATARSGNFSNADQNLTLSIIDSESAQILIEEVANTKYVADFVTKINGKTFKYGDILALNIHADSKLSNPTLYGTDKNSSANCIGKNQYFQITPDGIVNYTANIHVEPLEILGQGVVHSTVLTGQTYTNAEVSVSVDGQTFTAQANDDGVFTVEIHSQPGFNAHTIIRVNVGGFEVSVNPQLLTAKNLVQQTNTGYSYVLNADLETLTTPFADHVLYGRSLLSDEGKKAWDLAYRLLLNYDNSADEYPRDGSGNVRFYVDYAAHGIEITKTEAQYIQKYLVVNEPRMFLLKDWSASPVYENGVIVGQNFYIGNSAQNGNDYQQQLLETEVVVSGILSKITPDMSVYQILKTLQKEYQRVVRYENAGTPGDIRGPFIGLNAVCGGYAKGYEYLLQRVGIQATWVSGDTSYGYHAWNNINLYGSWYLTDTTWGTHLNGTNQITNHHPRNTYHVMPTLQAESIPAGLGDLGQTIAELTGVVDYEYHADGTMTVTYADPNALNTQVEIHTSQNEYNPIAMEKTQAGLWTVTIPVASESEETLDFFFTVNNQFKTIGNIQVNDLSLIDYDNGMKNIIVATLNVDKATLTELISASNYAQADYTPTSFTNYTLALDNAKTVVADEQATAITIAKAYRELQTQISALVKANVVEFKGYNNVVFLTLKFDAITQQLQAESNGQMVHPYQYSKVYAKVDHFDQQGKLKATYSVKANQTADEMAAALNGTEYVAGDYLQFSHLEKNNRLVIKGYVENAP
ncbi:MAG: putative mucin/carbohydrate-binding domain-containing protein, partial [Culicoidibacterales bacterium]